MQIYLFVCPSVGYSHVTMCVSQVDDSHVTMSVLKVDDYSHHVTMCVLQVDLQGFEHQLANPVGAVTAVGRIVPDYYSYKWATTRYL